MTSQRTSDGQSSGERVWPVWRSSVVLGVLATVAMVLHICWPRPVGQAPHPDGDRYLCQLNAHSMVPRDAAAPRYWDYALFQWIPGAEMDRGCIQYPSSQVWILRVFVKLTEWTTGSSGALDLRWGVVSFAVFVGLAVGLFAAMVRRDIWRRIGLSALLLLVVGDSTFASYSAGPMGEFPGILGVVMVCLASVLLGRRGLQQWVGLGAFAMGSGLVLTSKVQAVTLVVPLALFLGATSMRPWPDRSVLRTVQASPSGGWRVKVAPVLLALGLLAPTAWMLDSNPEQFRSVNAWELISVGILGPSHDPAGDLAEMGLPGALVRYAGKTACDDNCATLNDPVWRESRGRFTYRVAGEFLLRHPGVALDIAQVAAQDFATARPGYLGSFPPGPGHAPQENDLSLLASGLQLFRPHALPVLLVSWGVLTACAVRLGRSGQPGSWRRAFAGSAGLMLSFSVVQFLTATYGEAIENTKHLVLAILAFALTLVMALAARLSAPTRT
ncbi:hypothetical protein SAMN04489867_3043 [Pedococcus dokdonensis]|uniref:Dolichyl-phosphate-mannose-protein mannosyltransferase n=1 Tax=Pedococcus dokdonensis TaxID=443156 RepID=A0A1H0TZU3_9MICO|nr:hypothetical protein SAMN04489867_3043 [Pedococcus dokdonensis]